MIPTKQYILLLRKHLLLSSWTSASLHINNAICLCSVRTYFDNLSSFLYLIHTGFGEQLISLQYLIGFYKLCRVLEYEKFCLWLLSFPSEALAPTPMVLSSIYPECNFHQFPSVPGAESWLPLWSLRSVTAFLWLKQHLKQFPLAVILPYFYCLKSKKPHSICFLQKKKNQINPTKPLFLVGCNLFCHSLKHQGSMIKHSTEDNHNPVNHRLLG